MRTPSLSTAIKSQIHRREHTMQTAFPAKVLSYTASSNVVRVEPQFVEAYFTRDWERVKEDDPDNSTHIHNVPVCFPRHMSWTVQSGDFGLVICTKYSLDKWRNERRRLDPGDLRRFTMSGATFHPVLMDETPVNQQFVALANLVKDALDEIATQFDAHAHASFGASPTPVATQIPLSSNPNFNSNVASTTVKVSE